ncbi:hypothetical protein KAR91_01915 [Candidatus Pacearchaeota archaeon]|nr:hypothetical protein [Candidatus Pacearchaeota archaeon]
MTDIAHIDETESPPVVKGFSDNKIIPQSKEKRDKIFALQEVMGGMPCALDKFPVTHHFAPGTYAREMFLPANHTIIGKIHKHAHINIISKGKVMVYTEEGPVEKVGPCTFTSLAGTKRAVFVVEDTIWTTIHVTDKTDLDEIEEEIIATDYDEIKELEETMEGKACLGD